MSEHIFHAMSRTDDYTDAWAARGIAAIIHRVSEIREAVASLQIRSTEGSSWVILSSFVAPLRLSSSSGPSSIRATMKWCWARLNH